MSDFQVFLNYLFFILVLYKFKHFLADYPLQGQYMLGKFLPGWGWVLPLTAHCAVQAAFTFMIGLIVNPRLALVGALIDFVLHFIMDRLKASPNLMGRWKNFSGNEYGFIKSGFLPPTMNDVVEDKFVPNENGASGGHRVVVLRLREATVREIKKIFWHNKLFWNCLGIDQLVHGLTDLFVLYIFLRF